MILILSRRQCLLQCYFFLFRALFTPLTLEQPNKSVLYFQNLFRKEEIYEFRTANLPDTSTWDREKQPRKPSIVAPPLRESRRESRRTELSTQQRISFQLKNTPESTPDDLPQQTPPKPPETS